MGRDTAPLWTCAHCGRAFANRNPSHACGRWTLDPHFDGKPPRVRKIYCRFLAMPERFGPVESFSPRNHAHHFRLDTPDQVDALEPYAREAYAVGRQEHLRAP